LFAKLLGLTAESALPQQIWPAQIANVNMISTGRRIC
jgi:hypothetical protein